MTHGTQGYKSGIAKWEIHPQHALLALWCIHQLGSSPNPVLVGVWWRSHYIGVDVWVLSHVSHIWLHVTPWTVAHQAPLSMGLSRQECWSGMPCPPPGHLPNSGIEPTSLMSPALAGKFFATSATWHNRLNHWPLVINSVSTEVRGWDWKFQPFDCKIASSVGQLSRNPKELPQ